MGTTHRGGCTIPFLETRPAKFFSLAVENFDRLSLALIRLGVPCNEMSIGRPCYDSMAYTRLPLIDVLRFGELDFNTRYRCRPTALIFYDFTFMHRHQTQCRLPRGEQRESLSGSERRLQLYSIKDTLVVDHLYCEIPKGSASLEQPADFVESVENQTVKQQRMYYESRRGAAMIFPIN